MLGDVQQASAWEQSICPFLWCKYFHQGRFQANVTSLNSSLPLSPCLSLSLIFGLLEDKLKTLCPLKYVRGHCDAFSGQTDTECSLILLGKWIFVIRVFVFSFPESNTHICLRNLPPPESPMGRRTGRKCPPLSPKAFCSEGVVT